MTFFVKNQRNFWLPLLSVCLIVLISACTSPESAKNIDASLYELDNNPYTGAYQLEKDPANHLTIYKQDGKLYVNSVIGFSEIKVNEDNSYVGESLGVTGDFLSEEQGEFQKVVAKFRGTKYRFTRIK